MVGCDTDGRGPATTVDKFPLVARSPERWTNLKDAIEHAYPHYSKKSIRLATLFRSFPPE